MDMTQTTAAFTPGAKYHVFEQAGLGQAPYRYAGCTENVFVSGCGTVRKAGGSCDYCGAGILWQFWLVSADGRRFKVGSDCILKTDSDRALRVAVETEVQTRKREQRQAKAEVKRQKEVAIVQAAKAKLPLVAEVFKAQPHPLAASGPFFADKTLLDWAEWMFANAGLSGALSVAKRVHAAVEAL